MNIELVRVVLAPGSLVCVMTIISNLAMFREDGLTP